MGKEKGQASIQIGKNGLSDGILECLENAFKTRHDVKISVLKSAGHDKNKIREVAEEIINRLGNKYTYKIIGFTIFVKRWRKIK